MLSPARTDPAWVLCRTFTRQPTPVVPHQLDLVRGCPGQVLAVDLELDHQASLRCAGRSARGSARSTRGRLFPVEDRPPRPTRSRYRARPVPGRLLERVDGPGQEARIRPVFRAAAPDIGAGADRQREARAHGAAGRAASTASSAAAQAQPLHRHPVRQLLGHAHAPGGRSGSTVRSSETAIQEVRRVATWKASPGARISASCASPIAIRVLQVLDPLAPVEARRGARPEPAAGTVMVSCHSPVAVRPAHHQRAALGAAAPARSAPARPANRSGSAAGACASRAGPDSSRPTTRGASVRPPGAARACSTSSPRPGQHLQAAAGARCRRRDERFTAEPTPTVCTREEAGQPGGDGPHHLLLETDEAVGDQHDLPLTLRPQRA
jgi:hypothetical protein